MVVTGQEYDEAFIARFVEAGQKLAAKGCVGIVTSCGFLAMAQPECVPSYPPSLAYSEFRSYLSYQSLGMQTPSDRPRRI